jgi:hypothetical protein
MSVIIILLSKRNSKTADAMLSGKNLKNHVTFIDYCGMSRIEELKALKRAVCCRA